MKPRIWKDLDRFPGYQVSSDGQIRSLNRVITDKNGKTFRKKGVVLRPTLNGAGYRFVIVSDIAKNRVPLSIHRAVAEAFHGTPLENYQVNHKDGDKLNNDVSNLEWVTASENNQHCYDTKLRVPPRTQPHARQVRCVETNEVFDSMRAAAREYGLRPDAVMRVVSGNLKTTGGYTFVKEDK